MKFRLAIALPFVLGFVFLSTVWLLMAQERETAVTPVLPGSVLYKQLGGYAYAIAQQGDYVYLGVGSHLDVYDVQDATNPVLVAQTGLLTDSIFSLDLLGNYVVAASRYGLYMFDISNPLSPQFVSEYPLPSRIINDVEISGTLAFVAESRRTGVANPGGGFRVLDLSDPLHPLQLSLYSEGDTVSTFSLYNHYAYLSVCDFFDDFSCSNQFAVLDVSDPTALIEISNIGDMATTDSAIYSHYLYRKISGLNVEIYDLADPSAPMYVSAASFIPTNLNKIQVLGDKLYALDTMALRVYDLSTPTDPPPFGSYNPGVVGPQAVAVSGDAAFVAYRAGGLRIIDVAQGTLPEIGVYNPFGSPVAAVAVGDYAYILDTNRNLYVMDVAAPGNPVELTRYLHTLRSDMQLVGSDLFLSGWDGFEVVDVMEPLSPTLRSSYVALGYSVNGMQVEGDFAFLLNSDYQVDSLEIVDVTNRDQPVFAASTGSPCHYGTGLQVVGDYVYLSEANACSQHGQLTVVDVVSPTQPQIVAAQPISYEAGPIAYLNGYVYMGGYGVQIVDVTDPLSPTFAGRYTMTNVTDFGYEVTAVDGYLYVAADDAMGHPIHVVLDVSNPAAPVEVGTYLYTNGLPLLDGDDLYTYVPAAEDGLLIYLDSNTPPQVVYLPVIVRTP